MELRAIGENVIEVMRTVQLSDLEFDAAPAGYSTVLAWWLANHREALDLLVEPLSALLEDAERLQSMCERRGLVFHYVGARSSALHAVGLHEGRAFPVALLAEFYSHE